MRSLPPDVMEEAASRPSVQALGGVTGWTCKRCGGTERYA